MDKIENALAKLKKYVWETYSIQLNWLTYDSITSFYINCDSRYMTCGVDNYFILTSFNKVKLGLDKFILLGDRYAVSGLEIDV